MFVALARAAIQGADDDDDVSCTTDDAESKVTKEKLQEVLREFELDDDVNKVCACTRLRVYPTFVCFWVEDSSPKPSSLMCLPTPTANIVSCCTLHDDSCAFVQCRFWGRPIGATWMTSPWQDLPKFSCTKNDDSHTSNQRNGKLPIKGNVVHTACRTLKHSDIPCVALSTGETETWRIVETHKVATLRR
jgi:hypothetical protein